MDIIFCTSYPTLSRRLSSKSIKRVDDAACERCDDDLAKPEIRVKGEEAAASRTERALLKAQSDAVAYNRVLKAERVHAASSASQRVSSDSQSVLDVRVKRKAS